MPVTTVTGSTTALLSELLPSIIQEALFVASEKSIMRGLVKNYTLGPAQGKTINVPIYPQQTAVSLAENVKIWDYQSTGYANVDTSTATLTIGEVGIATHISDLARISSATNVVADIGRLFGEAIARKIDQDLTAKFTEFTTNVVGSSGNILAVTGAISAASVFQAVSKLRSAGVPSSDLACVLHPSVAYDLKANITNTFANPNAGIIQNEAMQMGYVGMLAGVPIYETSNFAAPSGGDNTVGDYIGGLFHRDALGFGLMQDIKIEAQRDALMRGDALVATALYATGKLYEAYGVAMAFDSSIVNP
jgi:N4-gp56 family major capsid protein